MKRILLAILQFVLFFLAFAAGSFLRPLNITQILSVTAAGTRIFIWDGLLIMTILAALILAIEAARKRLRTSGPWTFAAFALAAVLGLAAKLGFMTR